MQKQALNALLGKLCAGVLCASVLGGSALDGFAQTRGASKQSKQPAKAAPGKASAKKTSAPTRSSAWTGTITYTRSQSMSDSKTVQRVSGRGQDQRDWQMNYNYQAQVAVIEAPEKMG